MPLKSSVNWVASGSSVAAFGWVRGVAETSTLQTLVP